MADSELTGQLGQVEALILETYGLPLLAYLCATDEKTLRQRLENLTVLKPDAEQVLIGQLVPLAQHVASLVAARPGLPRRFSLDVLGTVPPGGTTSVATALRIASGGSVPDEYGQKVATDPVKYALTLLAIDAFPLLLAPTDSDWPMPRVSQYQHPQRPKLQEALQSDPVLYRLFEEDDPSIGKMGYALNSLGRGGSIQDVMFGEMIIASSWEAVRRTRQNPGLSAFIEQVQQSLDVIREAVRKGKPTVRGRLILTGFTTHDSLSIQTPWGLLRPLQEWERRLAPATLEGSVMGTDSEGKQVSVSYAGEMVLEMHLPYAVDILPYPSPSELPSVSPTTGGMDMMRRGLEAIQLAVLLATERPPGSWVTAKMAWMWAEDPLSHGPFLSWSDTRSFPGFMPSELSPEECEQVSKWTELIEAGWTPKIDISVRRLLSAANTRMDMSDRLVDSVIVWENLFGTSQGEPRLRIAASMSWLLAHDATAREALHAKLKALYDDRSKIVHGGQTNDADLAQSANAALSYARDALRALLRDRTDVLSLPDGAARSLRMIMGG
jgi:hypothetical protein